MRLEAHLSWCRDRNLRPTYITNRRRMLELAESQIGNLDTATAEDLQRWYATLCERVSPASRGVYLAHVRGYYQWLIWEELREDDPTARLMRPKLQRRLPRPISDVELKTAVMAAEGDLLAMLLLASLAGLRCCEIAGLRQEHIDRTRMIIEVEEGKGGKQRLVPLHPQLALVLPHRKGYLFRGVGHQRLSPWNVSYKINAHLRGLGFHATAHQLRHFFGTEIYRSTHDLRMTQELMGHASPQTTAGYAAWDSTAAGSAVTSLSIGPDVAIA